MSVYLSASYILMWILVIVQTLVIFALARHVYRWGTPRQYNDRYVEDDDMPVGRAAPEFSVQHAVTRRVTGSDQLKGQRLVILFVTTTCSICKKLVAELLRAKSNTRGLIVYCDGSGRGCRSKFDAAMGELPIFIKKDVDLVSLFELRRLPAAVAVDETWTIQAYSFSTDPRGVLQLLLDPANPEDGYLRAGTTTQPMASTEERA